MLGAGTSLGRDGTITEFSPEVTKTIIDGVQKEAVNRSIEELGHERDTMLLELLATRSRGEKAVRAAMAVGGGTQTRSK